MKFPFSLWHCCFLFPFIPIFSPTFSPTASATWRGMPNLLEGLLSTSCLLKNHGLKCQRSCLDYAGPGRLCSFSAEDRGAAALSRQASSGCAGVRACGCSDARWCWEHLLDAAGVTGLLSEIPVIIPLPAKRAS